MATPNMQGSHAEPRATGEVIPFPMPEQPLPPLPPEWDAFDATVIELEQSGAPTMHRGRGKVSPYHIKMSDGSVYDASLGEPLQQASPVLEASTTAYLTGLDGFNRHHLLKALECGFAALKISAERNWEGKLSQARTGYNLFQILRSFLQEQSTELNVDEDRLVLTGISRGAMLALAVKMYADRDHLDVSDMNLVVPCYPNPGKLNPETLADIAGRESFALARHLTSLPLPLLMRYCKSIDASHAGLRYASAAPKMLMNGDAGKFTQMLHPHTRAHISVFKNDGMCMGEVWQQLFETFPHIEVADISGNGPLSFNSHLRCINYGDTTQYYARQRALAKRLGASTITSAT